MYIKYKILIFVVFLNVNSQILTKSFEPKKFPININLGAHADKNGKWKEYMEVNNAEPNQYEVNFAHNTSETKINMVAEIDDLLTLQLSCSHDEVIYTKTNKRLDYTYMDGFGYFKYHVGPATWFEAFKICASEDAYLVVIDSEEEANMLKQIVNPEPVMTVTPAWAIHYALVGFHSLFKKGEYVTVKGQMSTKTGYWKWGQGEPNYPETELCGCIHRREPGLYDISCDIATSFVCEKDSN